MDVCFECGGKLKLIAKPNRTVWCDGYVFELAADMKMQTCISCGRFHEDAYYRAKIAKTVAGQRKNNPGQRLIMLSWVDKALQSRFCRPQAYAGARGLYSETILLLEFRELINKNPQYNIVDRLDMFLAKRYPNKGAFAIPPNISIEELAKDLSTFRDLLVNVDIKPTLEEIERWAQGHARGPASLSDEKAEQQALKYIESPLGSGEKSPITKIV